MSHQFENICVIGIVTLTEEELARIQSYSKTKIQFFPKLSQSSKTIAKHIGNSDCLLASRHLKLDATVFKKCTALKYIGIYGTSLENIDLDSAKVHKVPVKNVPQYYDYDIVEYVIAELLQKIRGLDTVSWWKAPSSLEGKTIGIVGLGAVGKGLAKVAQALKMRAVYFDQFRHEDVEKIGVPYRELDALLKESDIISVNVRVTSPMFLKAQFDLMKDGAILISISDGEVFKIADFTKWISNPHNLAIFDAIGGEEYGQFKSLKNVSISKRDAYVTKESFERLSKGFIKNLAEFCRTAAKVETVD